MRPEDYTDPVHGRHVDEDGRDLSYEDESSYQEFMRHNNRLEEQDRRAEKLPRGLIHLAYHDRPAPRERREYFDENRVRALQRPRTGDVEVQPRRAPIDRAA